MSETEAFPEVGEIVNEKYQVTHRIGAGSFGAIYEVQDIETGKIFAIKLEKHITTSPQLQYEYKLYALLDAPVGISRSYSFWTEPRFRGMVFDRLGLSLGTYFRRCGKILSLKTVLMCGIQILCRLEYLHQRSFIHRDIKPDNFVFGVGKESNLLYIIDFGLAKKYRDLVSHVHINYAEDKGLAGTARYVSINVHLGVEQSRRDDLESVGYVLISLLKGKLPWQGLEGNSGDDKYEKISQSKMDTTLEVLCEGLPSEFLIYMQKVRDLRFDENPPYAYLRNLFINLMLKNGYAFDYQYDWVISRAERLNNELKGDKKALEVEIPANYANIRITNHVQKQAFRYLQPLPLFSAMSEAAAFVGRAKDSRKGKEGEKPKKKQFVKEQHMFLLDPAKTNMPPAPIQVDFELDKVVVAVNNANENKNAN